MKPRSMLGFTCSHSHTGNGRATAVPNHHWLTWQHVTTSLGAAVWPNCMCPVAWLCRRHYLWIGRFLQHDNPILLLELQVRLRFVLGPVFLTVSLRFAWLEKGRRPALVRRQALVPATVGSKGDRLLQGARGGLQKVQRAAGHPGPFGFVGLGCSVAFYAIQRSPPW